VNRPQDLQLGGARRALVLLKPLIERSPRVGIAGASWARRTGMLFIRALALALAHVSLLCGSSLRFRTGFAPSGPPRRASSRFSLPRFRSEHRRPNTEHCIAHLAF